MGSGNLRIQPASPPRSNHLAHGPTPRNETAMPQSHDLITAASQRRAFLESQLNELRNELRQFDSDVEALAGRHRSNRQELASYLLGEASDRELKSIERRLNYPSLLTIKRRFEAELAEAEKELAALEQDEEAPHTELWISRVDDEIAEIKEVHDRLRVEVDAWRAIAWFTQLEGRGFFRPGYKSGFFGWFGDWRAVSLLMTALEARSPGTRFATPDAVRDAWRRIDDESQPIFELWDNLMRRKTSLLELQGRYNDLKSAPQRLFAQMYEALGDAIVHHLTGLSDEASTQLAAGDKPLVAFLQKESGISRQMQYLQELKARRLQPVIHSLEQDIRKLDMKIYKARSKARWYSQEEINAYYKNDSSKWNKRTGGVRRTRERISAFNNYHKGSFTSDYLWWDVMTSRARADDLYEVSVFRSRHPHFDHRHYDAPWHHVQHVHHDHFDDRAQHGGHGDAALASALAMDAAADALAGDLGGGDDGWAGDPS